MPKKSKNSFLEKLVRYLIIFAPTILFFSYYPNFHFGASNSMNFEVSLPLIWLVIFDFAAIILLAQRRLLNKIIQYWPWLLLPTFLTLSIFWSLNSLRGLLTVGIIWLLYFAGFAIIQLKNFIEPYRNSFYKTFFISTLVVCLWCWLQSILDLIGVAKENSLMCPGCTTNMFGFPHPNGFAIEPQFMGNLLLAPILTAFYLLINKKYVLNKTTLVILAFVFTATLFLTFSRGAIYAFAVAVLFMLIMTIVLQKTARSLFILPIIILAFIFTLVFQGVFSAVGPTNDTFSSGVAKALNHLSLGIIDLRNQPKPEPQKDPTPSSEPVKIESVFDGYVESSTDTRINLNDAAIDIWKSHFTTTLFGVGLGGAGEAMYINNKTLHPKEIVQNQFFSLLLETGLIGITLLVSTLVLIIKSVYHTKNYSLIFTLMLAYGITLCFFAGLPNALHIYLLPILLL